MEESNHRQHPRLSPPEEMVIAMPREAAVRVIDLSAGGVSIRHVEGLVPGDTHVLSFPLKGVQLSLAARVVWSHADPAQTAAARPIRPARRAGLQFVGLHPSIASGLREYLAGITAHP